MANKKNKQKNQNQSSQKIPLNLLTPGMGPAWGVQLIYP